jgi:hypothetical protein
MINFGLRHEGIGTTERFTGRSPVSMPTPPAHRGGGARRA